MPPIVLRTALTRPPARSLAASARVARMRGSDAARDAGAPGPPPTMTVVEEHGGQTVPHAALVPRDEHPALGPADAAATRRGDRATGSDRDGRAACHPRRRSRSDSRAGNSSGSDDDGASDSHPGIDAPPKRPRLIGDGRPGDDRDADHDGAAEAAVAPSLLPPRRRRRPRHRAQQHADRLQPAAATADASDEASGGEHARQCRYAIPAMLGYSCPPPPLALRSSSLPRGTRCLRLHECCSSPRCRGDH